jgi:hypothetical protein
MVATSENCNRERPSSPKMPDSGQSHYPDVSIHAASVFEKKTANLIHAAKVEAVADEGGV